MPGSVASGTYCTIFMWLILPHFFRIETYWLGENNAIKLSFIVSYTNFYH